ncbi:unnamed protein product [Boreogadus saida]
MELGGRRGRRRTKGALTEKAESAQAFLRDSSSDFSTSRSESLVRGELSLFRLAGYVRSEAVIVSGVPGGTDYVNEVRGRRATALAGLSLFGGSSPSESEWDSGAWDAVSPFGVGVEMSGVLPLAVSQIMGKSRPINRDVGRLGTTQAWTLMVPFGARGDGSFMGPAGGTEAGSSSPVGRAGRLHGHVSRSRAMACEVALLATAITSPLLSWNRKGSCSAGRGGLSRVGGKGGGGVSASVRAVRSASHALRAAALFLRTTARGQLMVLKEFEEVVHGSELVPGGPAFVIPVPPMPMIAWACLMGDPAQLRGGVCISRLLPVRGEGAVHGAGASCHSP